MFQAIAGPTDPQAAFIPSAWLTIVRGIAARLDGTRAVVLIRGEPGTGKEVMARLLHRTCARRDHGFIRVNCAGFSEHRLADELFGHERDAIPRLGRRRLGRLEFANHGTLFLDQIGDLPDALHDHLLRVLLDREFCRIGGQRRISVDIRLIASTTYQLLAARAETGSWQATYRLKVMDLRIPPLRERPEDVDALVSWFLARFNEQYRRTAVLARETLGAMARYSWPGNVRELKDVVEQLVLGADQREIRQELNRREKLADSRTKVARGA